MEDRKQDIQQEGQVRKSTVHRRDIMEVYSLYLGFLQQYIVTASKRFRLWTVDCLLKPPAGFESFAERPGNGYQHEEEGDEVENKRAAVAGTVADVLSALRLADVDENNGDEHEADVLYGKEAAVGVVHDLAGTVLLKQLVAPGTCKIKHHSYQEHDVGKNGEEQPCAVVATCVGAVAGGEAAEDGQQQ